LSRRPINDGDNIPAQHAYDDDDDIVFSVSTPIVVDNFLEMVKDGYQHDDVCKAVLANRGTAILSVHDDGYIYKGKRLYIPCIDSLKKTLLTEYHDIQCSGGHRGIAVTHHKLIQHYYWPNMYEDVVKYVRECHVCQQSKSVNQHPSGLYNHWNHRQSH
jgi:Integrase zinc binding domain